ncbi:3-hydroxyacyl-CoA dehydrogenase family protein [Amycolatopsis mediterranei]|uniref:3-hydroxyacyl-CoA dehydrogenase family protein n=1 Tax=Amycolatopsis mediterranei TaxID=33910 RepID=UPI0034276E3B
MLAIVGAGVMGTGLAALAVGHGHDVVLIEPDPAALATAAERVAGQVRLARLCGAFPRGTRTGTLAVERRVDALRAVPVDAVLESVVERPDVKRAVLADVAAAVPGGTLLGSTTSAIPVDELASATGRPGDVVGLHFMNPPYRIRAVEVVRGARTGEHTMRRTMALLDGLGARAVEVGDGPGFVVNRILQRMINEAARIVEEGRCSPAAVDAALTECLGHRTGPLATADLIGLDNVADSLRVLHERTGDDGYRPCAALLAKVAAGDLGRKTGRGFYEYGERR